MLSCMCSSYSSIHLEVPFLPHHTQYYFTLAPDSLVEQSKQMHPLPGKDCVTLVLFSHSSPTLQPKQLPREAVSQPQAECNGLKPHLSLQGACALKVCAIENGSCVLVTAFQIGNFSSEPCESCLFVFLIVILGTSLVVQG